MSAALVGVPGLLVALLSPLTTAALTSVAYRPSLHVIEYDPIRSGQGFSSLRLRVRNGGRGDARGIRLRAMVPPDPTVHCQALPVPDLPPKVSYPSTPGIPVQNEAPLFEFRDSESRTKPYPVAGNDYRYVWVAVEFSDEFGQGFRVLYELDAVSVPKIGIVVPQERARKKESLDLWLSSKHRARARRGVTGTGQAQSP